MRCTSGLGCAVAAALLLSATVACACHVSGGVICEQSGEPMPGVRIDFVSTTGAPYTGSVTTDAFGQYTIALPIALACYTATVALSPGQSAVIPPSGQAPVCIADLNLSYTLDVFVISDPICESPVRAESGTWGALKSAYK